MRNGGWCSVRSMASSFLIGGLIGGVSPCWQLLPQERSLEQQIVGLAQGVKGKAGDYYGQLKETVTSALEEGKGLIDEKKRLISRAVQAGIEAYEKEKKERV